MAMSDFPAHDRQYPFAERDSGDKALLSHDNA